MTSPCIGVCTIEDVTCVGCGRTIEEIIAWSSMTESERETIVIRVSPTRNPSQGALLSIVERET